MRTRTDVHALLEDAAARHGAATALTDKGGSCTYDELWLLVRRAAGALRHAGLRPGDRVAIYLDKRIETVAAIFAASTAGAAFVPINPVLRAPQVGHILADSGARVLVTSGDRLATLDAGLDAGLGDGPAPEHVVLVGDVPAQARLGAARLHPWSSVAAAEPAVPHRGVDGDVAAILYTSGSTGRPKGVVLSHRNLLVGAESVSEYLGNTADDVILAALPLSFDAGLSQVTTGFCVGAHVVLHNYLLPRDLVRACATHGVTALTCVAPLWIQLADVAWPPEAAQRIRYFANTGGRMPKATLGRLREALPQAAPYLMYGLTEAFRSTYLDPAEVDRRPDSIGKAIPNAEVLVVRPDGTLCGPGEEGELVHRGPLVALGYWNDAERSAERFRPAPGEQPPWRPPELAVWSGDTVVRDAEGFLYFVGRSDEMIKTSGYRVSPTEIEEAAYDTGTVRDAVAVGLEDARLGQRVVLVVTPADEGLDPEALVASLRRTLPLYMVPAQVVVRDQIPRSPNGKFDRLRVRESLS